MKKKQVAKIVNKALDDIASGGDFGSHNVTSGHVRRNFWKYLLKGGADSEDVSAAKNNKYMRSENFGSGRNDKDVDVSGIGKRFFALFEVKPTTEDKSGADKVRKIGNEAENYIGEKDRKYGFVVGYKNGVESDGLFPIKKIFTWLLISGAATYITYKAFASDNTSNNNTKPETIMMASMPKTNNYSKNNHSNDEFFAIQLAATKGTSVDSIVLSNLKEEFPNLEIRATPSEVKGEKWIKYTAGNYTNKESAINLKDLIAKNTGNNVAIATYSDDKILKVNW
ncbi:hypothetical protein JXA48_03460 [Candidatus Woesearchaeota archaeon]|nr:hypothetical protein [Candidatus Woesearchaeota archaeon]